MYSAEYVFFPKKIIIVSQKIMFVVSVEHLTVDVDQFADYDSSVFFRGQKIENILNRFCGSISIRLKKKLFKKSTNLLNHFQFSTKKKKRKCD